MPDRPYDLYQRVAQLRAAAVEARNRARIYYEMADTRGERGSSERTGSCCDLGWIATEKAEVLEAEIARLENTLLARQEVRAACLLCNQPVRRTPDDRWDTVCSASCRLASYMMGPPAASSFTA